MSLWEIWSRLAVSVAREVTTATRFISAVYACSAYSVTCLRAALLPEYTRTTVPMTQHGLEQLTHLDAIGIMATARHRLREDKTATRQDLAEATRLLKKASAFQLSLTNPGFDFDY